MKGPESANPETNRSVVARGWREREWRVTATAIRVLYGLMNFPKLTAGMDTQLFEHTKTTELYTLSVFLRHISGRVYAKRKSLFAKL